MGLRIVSKNVMDFITVHHLMHQKVLRSIDHRWSFWLFWSVISLEPKRANLSMQNSQDTQLKWLHRPGSSTKSLKETLHLQGVSSWRTATRTLPHHRPLHLQQIHTVYLYTHSFMSVQAANRNSPWHHRVETVKCWCPGERANTFF